MDTSSNIDGADFSIEGGISLSQSQYTPLGCCIMVVPQPMSTRFSLSLLSTKLISFFVRHIVTSKGCLCGLIVPQADMPSNEAVYPPILIMNAHGFPTQLTVGQLFIIIGWCL
jgi:hypothetical protein